MFKLGNTVCSTDSDTRLLCRDIAHFYLRVHVLLLRILNCDEIQNLCLTLNKALNVLTYGLHASMKCCLLENMPIGRDT